MPPAPQNINLYQGDTYSLFCRLQKQLDLSYINLTGCIVLAQIRSKSDHTVVATFNTPIADQTLYTGGFWMWLTSAQTTPLTPGGGTALLEYDLQVTDLVGNVTTYLRGDIFVTAQVSRLV